MSRSLTASLADIRPRYIPQGFVLWQVTDGSVWGGFNDLTDQLRLGYAREDGLFGPLQVAVARVGSSRVLFGTEDQPGAPIDIGVASSQAVYHDGIWSPGNGPGRQVVTAATTLHWDTALCHSVVGTFAGLVCAVRAWRTSGLDVRELVKVVASVAPAGAGG